jgi:hypothetical protein
MLIDFNFSSISWTIFYLRVGRQMVCFPDRFWSDALADLTNICLFAFGLLATSRYYIVHVLASACAVEGCAEARSVAAPKESAPTSGLTFSIAKGKTMARSPPRKLQVARRDILCWQEYGVMDVRLMLQSWHGQCSTCLPRFELNIKHPWWHSQSWSLCLSPSNLRIALLLQGGSQAKEYFRYIPDICPNDSERISQTYTRYIPYFKRIQHTSYILHAFTHTSPYNAIHILYYILHMYGIYLRYDHLCDVLEICPTNDFYEISVPVTLPFIR